MDHRYYLNSSAANADYQPRIVESGAALLTSRRVTAMKESHLFKLSKICLLASPRDELPWGS